MKILDQLISSLNFENSIKDIHQGVFHTAVLICIKKTVDDS
jgi:hypothetical protein